MKLKLGITSLVFFLLPTFCFAIDVETVSRLIVNSASKYGILEEAPMIAKVIYCESGLDEKIQSRFINKAGKRENSWGLAQINLDYNPQVKLEEAISPQFATDFIAYHFSIGKKNMWTCYRNIAKANSVKDV